MSTKKQKYRKVYDLPYMILKLNDLEKLFFFVRIVNLHETQTF